jgi:hypothetical protein
MRGGKNANFDPGALEPSVLKAQREGVFLQGLLGGYLPAVRYVYPDGAEAWIEMIAFAPFRTVNSNPRAQPVWYRVSRIERGALKWARYVDSYLQFPMRKPGGDSIESGDPFYADLFDFRRRWESLVEPAMKISVPEKRVENMARFSLISSLMTRADNEPRYGVIEANYSGYGAAEHDGFPDTFTVQTSALIDWGLLNLAGRYLQNYLDRFVREKGELLYRGPEIGQYGRMLSVFAHYLNAGGDSNILIANRQKVEGIATLLLALRADAMNLPKSDPAFGLLVGWSEADSCLLPDPIHYMQPYFSNSAQAVRGFEDFGNAWHVLAQKRDDPDMERFALKLLHEAGALKEDLDVSISRSTLIVAGHAAIPAIPGSPLLPDEAIARDQWDPQWQYFRVYMEMLESGILTDEQVRLVQGYLQLHHGLVLGLPASFDRGQYQSYGFLSTGYANALIETDQIPEALLMLYSEMAHQYTRGTWIAQEERDPLSAGFRGPWMGYSVAAQLTVATLVRWLLVYEDSRSPTLWLAKGTPTAWLHDGESLTVSDALTRWGRVSFSIISHVRKREVFAQVTFPPGGINAETRLRLRTTSDFHFTAVTLNGKIWSLFDSSAQTITLPAGTSGRVSIVARMSEPAARSH